MRVGELSALYPNCIDWAVSPQHFGGLYFEENAYRFRILVSDTGESVFTSGLFDTQFACDVAMMNKLAELA